MRAAMTASAGVRARRLKALLCCAVAALFLVGVAGAGSSASFTDPVGDAGKGLDITGLDVSKDDTGRLTFRVTVAGNHDWDLDQAEALVALDIDQNPDTGSAFYGTEVEIAFEADQFGRTEAVLLRAHGWDFRRVSPPEGWGWGFGPNFLEFYASASDLGLSPKDRKSVV